MYYNTAIRMELSDAVRYFASMCLTVAGAVALVVEFRHPATRRITRFGVTMLIVVITCGCLLIAIQAASDATERQQRLADQHAREVERRQLLVLQEQLKRAEFPLTAMHMLYVFRANDDQDGQLHTYLTRVRRKLAPHVGHVFASKEKLGVFAGVEGRQYYICPGSSLFPDRTVEPDVWRFASTDYFPLAIFRKPVDLNAVTWLDGSTLASADLWFFVNQLQKPTTGCSLCGCVYVGPDFNSLFATGIVDVKREGFTSSGHILSAVDLAGSQIVIESRNYFAFPFGPLRHRGFISVHPFAPTIDFFRLKLGVLGEMSIPFKQYPRSNGILHEFVFPADFREVVALGSPQVK